MVAAEKWEKYWYERKCIESVKAETGLKKTRGVFCRVIDIVSDFDSPEFHVLFFRVVKGTVAVNHLAWHCGNYHRGLKVTAENSSETSRKGTYYRKQTETVQVEGKVFRGLLIFIRIVTGLFVRDYLLGRFLKARQELVLKSCVSREIVLESKIN